MKVVLCVHTMAPSVGGQGQCAGNCLETANTIGPTREDTPCPGPRASREVPVAVRFPVGPAPEEKGDPPDLKVQVQLWESRPLVLPELVRDPPKAVMAASHTGPSAASPRIY